MPRKNSPIQAAGIGKNSKRHDLDGTPGLSEGSSLNQGEVSQLEQGQQAVDNTQGQPVQGQPLPPAQQEVPVAAPDPMAMAKRRLSGDLQVPERELSRLNTAQWLPLIERLASNNASSPLLRRAYVQMLTRLRKEPFSGSTAVVNKNELDQQVNDAF